MAFKDVRFPPDISYGAVGGPGFKTDVVMVASGNEKRNATWPRARGRWDVSHGVKSPAQKDALQAFFYVMRGQADSFRFKDWSDFTATVAQGVLGTGKGDGGPTYQFGKLYTAGAFSYLRQIYKLVTGTVAVQRNGGAVTVGGGAGNIAIDFSTGVGTFVADAQSAATGITVGATTTVVLSTNPGTLVAAQRLYLSGFTGAGAGLVNNLAHTVNSVSGAGPFTFVLATNTAGATITLGSGLGRRFPQVADALTWSGEFDVPARFNDDNMNVGIDDFNIFSWERVSIIETRDIV